MFEYLRIELNNRPIKVSDVDVLNEFGAQGWELVAITVNRFCLPQAQDAQRAQGQKRCPGHSKFGLR
jgi:hypothetical protein